MTETQELAGMMIAGPEESLRLSRSPVNIRVSIPLLRWRVYLAVLAGVERRGAERRAVERLRHPLHTVGNVLFAASLAVLFVVAVILAVALQSAILEF